MTRPDNDELFEHTLLARTRLRMIVEEWPPGLEKEALQYYLDCGNAVDTATPETIAEIIAKIIMENEGNIQYEMAIRALHHGPLT
jgi:hypothetical protein